MNGKCKNSFGPWAFEFGPKTPVTMNYAVGYYSFNVFIKGIEPPSPNVYASFL